MGKLYFLAKYISENLGGGMIRQKQIDHFRGQGVEVILVMPDWQASEVVVEDARIKIPIKGNLRFQLLKEYVGFAEDYLDPWTKKAYYYLRQILKPDDIMFASASGELSSLKLASILKAELGIRYIANLHDPLSFSIVNGRKFGTRPHVSREKSERRYLANADLIITCSMTYCNALKNKHPEFSDRIINSYFGFTNKAKLSSKKKHSNKLRIAYGGTYFRNQSPEILADVAAELDEVEIFYIGNHGTYKPLHYFKNRCIFVNTMQNNDYNRFFIENIDVGFVSLSKDFLGACVPSKIYEYINLGLPILGALPEGDAKNIINECGYGIAVDFNKNNEIKQAIHDLMNRDKYLYFQNKIMQDRAYWSMERHLNEISTHIQFTSVPKIHE